MNNSLQQTGGDGQLASSQSGGTTLTLDKMAIIGRGLFAATTKVNCDY